MANRQPQPLSQRLSAAAVFLGLGAGLAQVVILRELLVLAGGNELSLGPAMACWLFWTAMGSLVLGKAAPKIRLPQVPLALILTGLAGAVSLILARLAPFFAGIQLGVVMGLGQGLVCSLAVLAPVGLAAGAGFPLILASASGAAGDKSRLLSWLYGVEALGSMAAGALFALILVHWLNPLEVVFGGALAMGLAASCLYHGRLRPWAAAWAALMVLGLIWAGPMDQSLRALQWRGRHLAAVTESPYAQLAATQNQGQINFFASGLWLFSYPDRATFERAALLPLLAAPKAQSALFIGGGASPVAELAARRGGLAKVTAVELDPWLVNFTARLLPKKERPPNLRLAYGDGRLFLQQAGQRYDLIVLNLPPPVTVQLNRFYSAEGFADLAGALTPKGVAVISLPGMEQTVGRLRAWQLNSILSAARLYFGQVLIMSGPELRLFLCPRPDTLPLDVKSWQKRLQERGWKGLAALRPDTLAQDLSPLRLAFLHASLKQAGDQPPNLDFKPRAFLFDSQLWGAWLGGRSNLAASLAKLRIKHLLWALLGLFLLSWAIKALFRKKALATGFELGQGIFITGLTAMALSVLLLMAYQILFGAVYVGLAFVLAGFMLGMAVAAMLAGPRLKNVRNPRAGLAVLSALLALACLANWGLINLLHKFQAGALWAWALLCLAAVDGGLTGAYFGLAGRAGLGPTSPSDAQKNNLAPVGGRLYGLDLAGGVLGALMPVVLLPTVGLGGALLVLAVLNLMALAGFLGRSRDRMTNGGL